VASDSTEPHARWCDEEDAGVTRLQDPLWIRAVLWLVR
jgi:hypothetical protein